MKVLKVFAVIITDKQERTFSVQSSSISDNMPRPQRPLSGTLLNLILTPRVRRTEACFFLVQSATMYQTPKRHCSISQQNVSRNEKRNLVAVYSRISSAGPQPYLFPSKPLSACPSVCRPFSQSTSTDTSTFTSRPSNLARLTTQSTTSSSQRSPPPPSQRSDYYSPPTPHTSPPPSPNCPSPHHRNLSHTSC